MIAKRQIEGKANHCVCVFLELLFPLLLQDNSNVKLKVQVPESQLKQTSGEEFETETPQTAKPRWILSGLGMRK